MYPASKVTLHKSSEIGKTILPKVYLEWTSFLGQKIIIQNTVLLIADVVDISKGDNELTELLLRRLNSSGAVHMVPASLQGRYVIRFTVTSSHTKDADIERDWSVIRAAACDLLSSLPPELGTMVGRETVTEFDEPTAEEQDAEKDEVEDTPGLSKQILSDAQQLAIQNKRNRLRCRGEFGLSLLLSNVPMSPKFINGSFAALFDNVELLAEYARHISRSEADLNGSPMRMTPRRRLYLGNTKSRQYSLDQGYSVHEQQQQQQHSAARDGGTMKQATGGVDGGYNGDRTHNGTALPQRLVSGHLLGRQGSLDSKIEEIFQTPLNNTLTTQQVEPDRSVKVKAVSGSEQPINDNISKE